MAAEQLSREQLEVMLEVGKVDAGNGTLFGVENKRAPRKQGLTLVISSGGSGMSAIRSAMQTANQKLTPDFATYVKFIVVDSSTGEIDAMKKLGIDVINISSPGADQRLLAQNRDFFYKQFVPADYNITLLNSDGASQDRMTGKIKLYDKNGGKTNDELLRDKIEGLFKNEWKGFSDLPVDIMILTGISGGNGSGTFLDLAAQARKACPGTNDVRVYGYIMLPDTVERYANSTLAKNTLYRNGFAALKELESYMSIDFETDRKELFPSQVSANDVEISAVNRLYDFPVLISGDYDAAVNMIAETIVNSIADSDGKFEQRAFYSNNLTVRSTTLSKKGMMSGGKLNKDACPEDSHLYCGIGFANASIPEKIVIPNVVSRVSRKMYTIIDSMEVDPAMRMAFCTKERRLNRMDFEKAMRVLLSLPNNAPLNGDSLKVKVLSLLQSVASVGNNNSEISYQDLVNGNVKEYLKGFNVEKTVNNAIQNFPARIQDLFKQLQANAKFIMEIYGPRAIEYLYEGKGNDDEKGVPEDYKDICLSHQIEVVASEFNRLASTPGRYPGTVEQKGLWGRAIEAISKEVVNEWVGKAKRAAQQDVYSKVAQRMTGVTGGWKTEYEDRVVKFKDYCVRFASVIETMMDYYTGVGSSLDEADYKKFASSTGDPNGVNLCSDAKVYDWVRNRVEMKVNGITIVDAKKALIADFYENVEAWVSGEPGRARKQFDDVMSRICQLGKYAGAAGGLNLTITDYFEEVLKDVAPAQQTIEINNSVNDIMKRLLQTSAPSLATRNGKQGHINKVVLVPRKLMTGSHGTTIDAAFRAFIGDGDTMAVSSVVDAIVCYQASVGNALCDLKDLDLWENGYEAALNATTHLSNGEHVRLHMQRGYSQYTELTKSQTDRELKGGMLGSGLSQEDELVFGTGLAWKDYPSINILRYEGNFNSAGATTEERYRRDVFNKKIDKAVEYGIIECEQVGNTYKYWLNIIPGDWTNLSLKGYNEIGSNGLYARGQVLFNFLAGKNPQSASRYRKQIALRNSPAFGEEGFDFSEIIQLEHWQDERVKQEATSYMKRIMRKATGLYQDMEDTLYRFFDIEKELEEKEGGLVELQKEKENKDKVRKFIDFFANGVVNPDEEQYTWAVATNLKGASVELVSFSRKFKMLMDGFRKGIMADSMKLPIVYEKYLEMLDDESINEQDMDEMKVDVIESLSDKQFDTLLGERIEILKTELEAYKEVVGRAKDAVDAVMEKYELPDEEMSAAELVVNLYKAIEEELPKLDV